MTGNDHDTLTSGLDRSVGLNPLGDLEARYQEELERAYKLGLLHGINAQSMAQAELDVMQFEDYGWRVDDE